MNFIAPTDVAGFRALAESRMGSANGGSDVIVRRPTGQKTIDKTTGVESTVWSDVWSGPARIKKGPFEVEDRSGVMTDAGIPIMSFPSSTDVLQDDDYVEVTAGDCAGYVYRLRDTSPSDQRTALRVTVVEVPRPIEWGS